MYHGDKAVWYILGAVDSKSNVIHISFLEVDQDYSHAGWVKLDNVFVVFGPTICEQGDIEMYHSDTPPESNHLSMLRVGPYVNLFCGVRHSLKPLQEGV